MTPTRNKTIMIAGAGLAGPLMGIFLARRGYKVKLYEKRPDPRINLIDAGKSINLALSERGLNALRAVGLAEEVMSTAIPMRGRMIHSATGSLDFQPYGKDESESINSVSRPGLNITLLNELEKHDNVEIRFNMKCMGADVDTVEAEFRIYPERVHKNFSADVLIGADGAFSGVRRSFLRLDRFNYSQSYLEHGYKELTIPPGDGGMHRIDKNSLHIWPRGHFMMIALPNFDGSFTVTCFWPFDGKNSFNEITSEDLLESFFGKTFPDAVPLMPTLKQDFFENPTGSLVTILCKPHHYKDKVIIIGDSAHAVVPFYGQGMNASFEDCFILNSLLDKHNDDFGKAFDEYSATRIDDVNALADLSLENFIEMRDKVASHEFVEHKELEQKMRVESGEKYQPLYTMITFTNIPYAEAVAIAKRQENELANT